MAAALLMAGPASAAPTNPFGCRASVQSARPVAGLPGAEPYVANPAETPCVTDSAGAGQSSSGPAASSAPGAAYTVSDTSTPAATALASVNGGTTNGNGNLVVLGEPAQAQASFACVNGSADASASSNVTVVIVNGQTVRPVSPGAETTTQMGGGSYTTINQQVQTATSLTERAVFTHIEGVGDYVLGEAQVSRPAGNPCVVGTGAAGGSGSGGSGSGGSGSGGSGSGSGDSLKACPDGSVLVASAQMCEIVSADGSQTVVSKPFAGPTGGTVVTLAAARKKVKSACLSGTGPKFVVMGTNKANMIKSGKTPERILAMGGNDKVIVKNAASCVDGGTGADRITVGNGRDRVFGGAGNDVIRDSGRVEWVNGGTGRNVAYVTAKHMKYARRHGCQKVRLIRAKH